VANGTVTRPLLDFLARAARRPAILVCGGKGSRTTTTLTALSSFIGAEERVVTTEDAAELRMRQPHVVRREARQPNHKDRDALARPEAWGAAGAADLDVEDAGGDVADDLRAAGQYATAVVGFCGAATTGARPVCAESQHSPDGQAADEAASFR
jgi:hypothetical protein